MPRGAPLRQERGQPISYPYASWRALTPLAEAYAALGRDAEAERALETMIEFTNRALAIDEGHADVRAARGRALDRLADLRELQGRDGDAARARADADWRRLHDLRPDHAMWRQRDAVY